MQIAMNETSPVPGRPIHLPVVPTGRLNSLRQTMSDVSDPAPMPSAESSATAAPATVAVSPAAEPSALETPSDDPTKAFDRKLLEGRVVEAISQIYDPEIPVNIYELGLIYKVDVRDDKSVYVTMTLTAPACPVAGSLPGQVETKIETIPEVTKATVELVWDPPWSRDMMSEAAQLQLGLM
jgi:FeS assembly SUF system protein